MEISYENSIFSGKHMICDFKQIQNIEMLTSRNQLKEMLDNICSTYDFTILNIIEHEFTPQGLSIIYMLSESHISIHTFPEKKYMAFDIYTCRCYNDNRVYEEIYRTIVDKLKSTMETPIIMNRTF
jgi:S-adenosylmethionine decarboxylase